MVTGLTVVALSYFLVNLSFFSVLSREEIIGTEAVALVCYCLLCTGVLSAKLKLACSLSETLEQEVSFRWSDFVVQPLISCPTLSQ